MTYPLEINASPDPLDAVLSGAMLALGGGDADLIGEGLSETCELRRAQRYTVLLRTAKLLVDGREHICVVRDISETGVKIRLFHPLPRHDLLELEIDGGARHALTVVWTEHDHAGLRFVEPVEVAELIDALRDPRPRRQLRINVDQPLILAAHSDSPPALLTNMSQQGACIETAARLCLRERVRIESKLLPALFAIVCWRREPRYGLVFDQGFKLDDFAKLVARLHGGRKVPAPAAS